MRCLVRAVSMLTALSVWPVGLSAQEGDAEEIAEPPSTEAPETPISPRVRERTRQQWDPAVVYKVPTTPKPPPPKHPGLGPGLGIGISLASLAGGLAMVGISVRERICVSFGEPCTEPAWVAPVLGTGVVLTLGGFAGLIASATAFSDSDQWSSSQGTRRRHGRRRAQWDLAESRIVF